MKQAHETLVRVGFSEYEARAYCALLRQSPANGYQIAQLSGIPRGKVYECLDRLVGRGAAIQVETASRAKLFAPTDPNELLDAIEAEMSASCDRARLAMSNYQSATQVIEVLWRVTSQIDLIARGKVLADKAQSTLHVALWAKEYDALKPTLLRACKRGVKVALVLYGEHDGLGQLQDLGAGAILHSRSKREAVSLMGRQFVLVADRQRCITGSIFPDDEVEGVYTLNRGLVTNALDLVNHEIYLERILHEVGDPIRSQFGVELERLNAFDPIPEKRASAAQPSRSLTLENQED